MREKHGDGISLFGYNVSLKGVRPRVVLVLLLGGSFAGVWLSHWGDPITERVFWWVAVVVGGLLTGGLYWRLVLFDEDFFDDADAARQIRIRWDRLEAIAVWILAFCGFVSLGFASFSSPVAFGESVFAAGCIFSPVLWLGIRWYGSEHVSRRTTYLRSLLFLVVLVSLGGLAWMETGTAVLDWFVRFAHIGSFALWVGGAVWHNGIVLPMIRSRPAVAGGLKAQARRFRRHLPIVITLFLVTGIYQALQVVTVTPQSLLASPIGQLVGFKLLVLAVLTGLVVASVYRGA